MTETSATRIVAASPEKVFDTIAHIENFAKAVPVITHVGFLSESRTGVGTRFRETRKMGKRSASSVLEVTEYLPNERVRLVSDEGGTVWDTVFTVQPSGAVTELSMTMEARPYTLRAKLATPLFKRMVAKAVAADMDSVKAYCETSGT